MSSSETKNTDALSWTETTGEERDFISAIITPAINMGDIYVAYLDIWKDCESRDAIVVTLNLGLRLLIRIENAIKSPNRADVILDMLLKTVLIDRVMCIRTLTNSSEETHARCVRDRNTVRDNLIALTKRVMREVTFEDMMRAAYGNFERHSHDWDRLEEMQRRVSALERVDTTVDVEGTE